MFSPSILNLDFKFKGDNIMKLSEIKGDRALEVIADIMNPISNLLSDPETKKALKNTGKEPVIKILPQIIKTHKTDIYKIFAILDGVTVEEYAKSANMVKIIQDFSDVVMDESIQTLFTSAKPVEEKK